MKKANFANVVFGKNGTKDEYTSFIQTTFKSYAIFENAKFNVKNADFSAIQAERYFSLNGAQFTNCVPNFVQAHFQEAPLLEHIKIPEVPPKGAAGDFPAFYRALKRLALQGQDHEREQDFFAAELLALRKAEDEAFGKNAGRWWGGVFYQYLSDFGRSMFLPLQWLMLLIAVSLGIYLKSDFRWPLMLTITLAFALRVYAPAVGAFILRWLSIAAGAVVFSLPLWASAPCVGGGGNALSSALFLSLKRSILGFGLNHSEHSSKIAKCLYGEQSVPNIQDYWGIVQMLFSLVLIFLFLMAVRAKFRIK